MKTLNLLVGCTGSVATIKLPILVEKLKTNIGDNGRANIKLNIRIVVTEHAKHFYSMDDFSGPVDIYSDDKEWTSWKNRGDPVMHIELAKWADVMLIAPLDANTLAKISQGLCDNLLTCVARAWIFPKPLIFCPAMNTKMWEHPITAKQIAVLKEWGFVEISCIVKHLMCGDTGLGAMAEVDTIVKVAGEILKSVAK